MRVLKSIGPIFRTIHSSLTVVPDEFKGRVFIVILIAIIGSLLELFSISLMAPVFYLLNDEASVYKNSLISKVFKMTGVENVRDFLFLLMLILLIFFLLKSWIITLSNNMQISFSYKVSQKIMESRLLSFFKSGTKVSVSRELSDEVRSIYTIPSEYATHILTPSFLFIGEFAVLLVISTFLIIFNPIILFAVILVCLPLIGVIFYFVRKATEKNSKERKLAEPKSYNSIFHIVNGLNAIQTASAESFFISQSNSIVSEMHKLYTKTQVMQKIPQRIMEIFVIFIVVLVYGLMIYFFKESKDELITVLIMFGLAAYRLLPSINNLISYYIQIKSSFFVVEDLQNAQMNVPVIQEIHYDMDIQKFNLVNYTFNYNQNIVLQSVNLELRSGRTYGLFGDSGSGKSTLAGIITGNIFSMDNSILINDSFSTYHALRNRVNYVSSKEFIYDFDIYQNIALGKTLTEVNHKLLDEVIDIVGLNQGYQTKILDSKFTLGVTGSNISDGLS